MVRLLGLISVHGTTELGWWRAGYPMHVYNGMAVRALQWLEVSITLGTQGRDDFISWF